MLSRAFRVLDGEDLSDLLLSSDDEDNFYGGSTSPTPLPATFGADVIPQNRTEYDNDEEPRELYDGVPDQEPESSGKYHDMSGPQPEIPSTTEDILQDLTPKQMIAWRHKALVNTIPSGWRPATSLNTIVQAPIDYFYRYVPKQLFSVMADMTNLYAAQSNNHTFKATTRGELEVLFGLHLATGIFSYPCLKMYWETNISIPLFTANMTKGRFSELRNNLHLVDNTKIPADCKDVFHKVRPIYDAVRNRCLELPLEQQLCVDEQIVPFTGKHVAKQYIKGKPCPWGIKIFFLCGRNGQAYDFILYQTFSPEIDSNIVKKIGYDASIVVHLAKRIGESQGHELYFADYFSSYHLLQLLKQKGIMAACTARVNRFVNPTLLSDREINKKPRGFSQEVCSRDGDVTVVKWLDSKITHLASNFVGIGEKDLVKRWCKKEKRYIEVERPEVVKRYNHAMGGVDLLDQLMRYYKTFIKSRKWSLRMIFHASDLAVLQAYREYQMDNDLLGTPKKQQLTLLYFRRGLADSLVLQDKIPTAKRGRPSSSSGLTMQIKPRRPGEVRPAAEITHDGVGHFPTYDGGTGTRCKLVGCKGKSRVKCIKCKVHLCLTRDKNCFLAFHT